MTKITKIFSPLLIAVSFFGCSLVLTQEEYNAKLDHWDTTSRTYPYWDFDHFARNGNTTFLTAMPSLGYTSAAYGLPLIPIGLFPTDHVHMRRFDSLDYQNFQLSFLAHDELDTVILDTTDIRVVVESNDTIPPRSVFLHTDTRGASCIYTFDIPFYKTKKFTVTFGNALVHGKSIPIPNLTIFRTNRTYRMPIFVGSN